MKVIYDCVHCKDRGYKVSRFTERPTTIKWPCRPCLSSGDLERVNRVMKAMLEDEDD